MGERAGQLHLRHLQTEKGEGTAHFIRAVVLENLREVISFAREDTDGFIRQAMSNHMEARIKEQTLAQQECTEELRRSVEDCDQQSANMDSFLKLVRKYTVSDKLFPELLQAFVEKIVVHAPDKSSGHRTQQIDIHYDFIGESALSRAIDKKKPA